MKTSAHSSTHSSRQHLPVRTSVVAELVHELEASDADFLVWTQVSGVQHSVCREAFLEECRDPQRRFQRQTPGSD